MLGAEVDKPRKYSKIFENSGKRPFKAISTCQRPRFAAVWARAEAFQAAFQELSSEVDLGTQLDGGEAAGLGLLEVHRLAQALSEGSKAELLTQVCLRAHGGPVRAGLSHALPEIRHGVGLHADAA